MIPSNTSCPEPIPPMIPDVTIMIPIKITRFRKTLTTLLTWPKIEPIANPSTGAIRGASNVPAMINTSWLKRKPAPIKVPEIRAEIKNSMLVDAWLESSSRK